MRGPQLGDVVGAEGDAVDVIRCRQSVFLGHYPQPQRAGGPAPFSAPTVRGPVGRNLPVAFEAATANCCAADGKGMLSAVPIAGSAVTIITRRCGEDAPQAVTTVL